MVLLDMAIGWLLFDLLFVIYYSVYLMHTQLRDLDWSQLVRRLLELSSHITTCKGRDSVRLLLLKLSGYITTSKRRVSLVQSRSSKMRHDIVIDGFGALNLQVDPETIGLAALKLDVLLI